MAAAPSAGTKGQANRHQIVHRIAQRSVVFDVTAATGHISVKLSSCLTLTNFRTVNSKWWHTDDRQPDRQTAGPKVRLRGEHIKRHNSGSRWLVFIKPIYKFAFTIFSSDWARSREGEKKRPPVSFYSDDSKSPHCAVHRAQQTNQWQLNQEAH